MKPFIFRCTVFLLANLYATLCAAATYCVDPSGTGEMGCDATLQTIDEVNALISTNLQPGDSVLFKRGEVWREQLTITQSGLPTNPITFGAYGTGNNPLIKRSDPIGWWQESLVNGGFERFQNYIVDPQSPDFYFPWKEAPSGDSIIEADSNNALVGFYAAKINKPTASSGTAVLLTSKGLALGTKHYIRFYMKSSGTAQVSVRVVDNPSDSQLPDRWLQEDLVSWSSTNAPFLLTESSADWQPYSFSFTTLPDATFNQLRFSIRNGEGSVWLDEVIIVEGDAEPANKIWHGEFLDSIAGKIYGLHQNGQRISTSDTVLDINLLQDGQAISRNDEGILYRKDNSDLSELEAGHRVNAIRVEGQSHILIDGIDATGTGARPANVSGQAFGGSLIYISPGSHDITVKNLTVSQSSFSGISAGIFADPSNPYNIVYENVVSHSNESTGLYIRGGGEIRNSKTYDNGLLDDDTGDRGGIGLQEGPAIIKGNEVYSLAKNDRTADFAISICCGMKGRVEVLNNHVHDVSGGAIQIAGDNQPLSHLIAYNIVDGFGKNTATEDINGGEFAGIRLQDAPNTEVYNNVVANGGNHYSAYGLFIRYNAQNIKVLNNIFYNNIQEDIRAYYETDATNWVSNNNIYWRNNTAFPWWWLNNKYLTLDEWGPVLQQDDESLDVNPMFVDAANSDFRLQTLSPAMDKGAAVGLLSDYDENPIIELPDIGAFEIQDRDGDAVDDVIDNCLVDYNPLQEDTDGDGSGDVCDVIDPPTVTSVLPANPLKWGITTKVTIIGEAFQEQDNIEVSILPSSKIIVGAVTRISFQEIQVYITIQKGAKQGFRELTVTNPDSQADSLSNAIEIFK